MSVFGKERVKVTLRSVVTVSCQGKIATTFDVAANQTKQMLIEDASENSRKGRINTFFSLSLFYPLVCPPFFCGLPFEWLSKFSLHSRFLNLIPWHLGAGNKYAPEQNTLTKLHLGAAYWQKEQACKNMVRERAKSMNLCKAQRHMNIFTPTRFCFIYKITNSQFK